MTGKPITPDQVGEAQAAYLPPAVFDVFNSLIASRMDGGTATVYQEDAVTAICTALSIDRGEAFNKHYLDVEEAYRDAGWKVTYDKPGYNESYRAFFEFTKPKP